LKSEILSQEGNTVVVKAEYEAGEVDGAVGRTVRDMSKNASIKGFRRGHVPRRTLELIIGKNAIYRETVEHLATGALENVVSEYELDLVTSPKLKIGDLNEGSPMSIEFTFEVCPEVELPDVSSLSAEKTVYEVSDEEVEEGFRRLLESSARLEPADYDRSAEKDDIVEAQYSSYTLLDGKKEKDVERGKKNTLFLANLREDIASAVIGRKPAEEFEFDITLESDYPDSRMAGKTIRYEMEILNFMKRVVPEATDESIAEISKGKYNSVDEMKADLRKHMEDDASGMSDESLRESAVQALSAAAVVEIPESMVDRQYMSMRREQDSMLQREIRQSLEEYLKNNNLSVDKFEEDLRKRAANIVRSSLVLDALAERDEISFTSDDLNEEILRTARATGANPQELADSLSRDKEEFAALASRVRTKNTAKHLASLVQVTEKKAERGHVHEDAEDGHDHHEHDHGEAKDQGTAEE
jgi:trigger factor